MPTKAELEAENDTLGYKLADAYGIISNQGQQIEDLKVALANAESNKTTLERRHQQEIGVHEFVRSLLLELASD